MPATPITAVKPTDPKAGGTAPMTPVACDVTNGNSIPNNAGLMLRFKNTDAASRTVTFTTPATVSSHTVEDPVINLAAGASRDFSKLPVNAYGTTLEFTASSALVTVEAYQTT